MTHELKTGGDRGYLRIATEEAFATREQVDVYLRMVRDGTADKGMVSLWGFYATSPSQRATEIMDRLLDLGEQRLRHMDETGIDKAILALTSPGVQPFLDVEEAKRIARNANDYLAENVAAHPDRYYGMGTVAPQDPEWSASEIRRCAAMGFKGIQINSHTQGHYLDEPQFDPIFRALTDTGLLLYVHPATLPDDMMGGMIDAGLDGAVFGFAVETAYHLLRLVTSGLFDRYPDLQVMAGHGCEALPFWLYRTNYMHQAGVRSQRYESIKPLKHDLFHYMRNNFLGTCSGLPFAPAVKLMIDVMGEDRVLYAMDYPYEYVADEVRMMDNLDVTPEQKKKFFQSNAERWFKL
jgi:5-carboxyvanillate decarboxylase